LPEKRDKKGGKSLPEATFFIQGLVQKGIYCKYDDEYRKPNSNDGPKHGPEVNGALCGCGCGGTAALSEHYCGYCGHRMMAFCILEEGHGSKGLCFRCWKKHSHEADGEADGLL
jgi:hypothetical protein